MVLNWHLQTAPKYIKSTGFHPSSPYYFHSQQCKTNKVFPTPLPVVENISVKNTLYAFYYFKLWLLAYSQNSGGDVELVPSNCLKMCKKYRYQSL